MKAELGFDRASGDLSGFECVRSRLEGQHEAIGLVADIAALHRAAVVRGIPRDFREGLSRLDASGSPGKLDQSRRFLVGRGPFGNLDENVSEVAGFWGVLVNPLFERGVERLLIVLGQLLDCGGLESWAPARGPQLLDESVFQDGRVVRSRVFAPRFRIPDADRIADDVSHLGREKLARLTFAKL